MVHLGLGRRVKGGRIEENRANRWESTKVIQFITITITINDYQYLLCTMCLPQLSHLIFITTQ